MAGQFQISRRNPTAFLFVVDQSLSMGYVMPLVNKTKAQHVVDVINRTILNLIDLCNKADGIRDYFYVGVICYGKGVKNGLSDKPNKPILNMISEVADNVTRVETIVENIDNGLGEMVQRKVDFPIWLESDAEGETPMCAALRLAKDVLEDWCKKHIDAQPPTIIHITDGDPTDGDPTGIAEKIKNIRTARGDTLFFNLHISSFEANTLRYPFNDDGISNQYAKMLFQMSSVFPSYLVEKASERGYRVNKSSRGFVFNADAVDIVNFLEIGTMPSNQKP